MEKLLQALGLVFLFGTIISIGLTMKIQTFFKEKDASWIQSIKIGILVGTLFTGGFAYKSKDKISKLLGKKEVEVVVAKKNNSKYIQRAISNKPVEVDGMVLGQTSCDELKKNNKVNFSYLNKEDSPGYGGRLSCPQLAYNESDLRIWKSQMFDRGFYECSRKSGKIQCPNFTFTTVYEGKDSNDFKYEIICINNKVYQVKKDFRKDGITTEILLDLLKKKYGDSIGKNEKSGERMSMNTKFEFKDITYNFMSGSKTNGTLVSLNVEGKRYTDNSLKFNDYSVNLRYSYCDETSLNILKENYLKTNITKEALDKLKNNQEQSNIKETENMI